MNHLSKINKHNHLVEASYRLSLVAQRVFLLVLAKINPTAPLESSYEIMASEYVKTYKVSSKRAYDDIRQGADELYEADIRLHDLQLKILTRRRIVDEAKYHYGEGKISISFPKKLEQFLCQLKSEYTQYRIGEVAGLKSTYSIRLFELLIQFKRTGERVITIKKLKDWFRLDKRYDRFSDLKKRVIDPAINELNSKTNFLISYELIKKGRKIEAFSFNFKENDQTKFQFE